jgi:hypothetical protein
MVPEKSNNTAHQPLRYEHTGELALVQTTKRPEKRTKKATWPGKALPCGSKQANLLLVFGGQMFGVLLVELLDTAGRVNQLLLAGKKGMAGGTDFHIDFFVHGAEFEFAAAGAFGHNLVVLGMNVRFHGYPKPPKEFHQIYGCANKFILLPVQAVFWKKKQHSGVHGREKIRV